jgi:hypothetical protein
MHFDGSPAHPDDGEGVDGEHMLIHAKRARTFEVDEKTNRVFLKRFRNRNFLPRLMLNQAKPRSAFEVWFVEKSAVQRVPALAIGGGMKRQTRRHGDSIPRVRLIRKYEFDPFVRAGPDSFANTILL